MIIQHIEVFTNGSLTLFLDNEQEIHLEGCSYLIAMGLRDHLERVKSITISAVPTINHMEVSQ